MHGFNWSCHPKVNRPQSEREKTSIDFTSTHSSSNFYLSSNRDSHFCSNWPPLLFTACSPLPLQFVTSAGVTATARANSGLFVKLYRCYRISMWESESLGLWSIEERKQDLKTGCAVFPDINIIGQSKQEKMCERSSKFPKCKFLYVKKVGSNTAVHIIH